MVLPYTDMNLPWVCMCSPSWTPLPPPSPSHPSVSSQCTSPEHPVSCIEPGLVICFTYDIHVSMLFSQIIPPSPSPRVQKSVLYICVSCMREKFYIHVFIYFLGEVKFVYRNAQVWRVQLYKFWQRMCVINVVYWHPLWHLHKDRAYETNLFWPYLTAGGILVLWPGTEPASPALEGRILTPEPPSPALEGRMLTPGPWGMSKM